MNKNSNEVKYPAGIVTAYGAAVKGGYTGTYEEFCQEQAGFAANAQQVAEDRAAVEALVPDVTAALEAAEAEITQAVTDAEDAMDTKAAQTIASIPDDYTALSNEVDDLKSNLNNVVDIQTSENKWNPSLALENKQISNSSSTLGKIIDGDYTVSGPIPVTNGHTVMWYYSNSEGTPTAMAIGTTAVRIAEYDEGMNCLLVTPNFPTLPYTVQNSNTYYVRLAVAERNWNMVIIDEDVVTTVAYIPYAPNLNLIDKIIREKATVAQLTDQRDVIRNLIDIQTSENKWNPALALNDKSISNSTSTLGQLIDATERTTSGFIPVTKGHTVMWYYSNSESIPTSMAISSTAIRIAEYDEDMNCLLVSPGFPTLPYTVQNVNTYYVRIEVATKNWNMVIIDEDVVTTVSYVPYAPNLNLQDALYKLRITDPGLVLPKKIPSVVDMPTWCYFENVLSNAFLQDYIVTTEGELRTRRNALKDVRTSAGTYSKTVYVFLNGVLLQQNNVQINAVVKETAEAHTINVLCMGDSKTEATGKRVRINELVANDPYLTVNFLGTNGASPTLSEGWSGRNIVDVCTSETLNNKPNIFYDASISGTIKFNFAQGVATLGTAPDVVFIDHGTNQYGIAWSTIQECYDAIIASIHDYDSSIKVVVCVQESSGLALKPDYTQGNKQAYGFGNSSGNYSIPKMISAYDDRESENIFLCPQYLCIDLYKDFPLALLPVSPDNTMCEYLCLDTTHPGTNIGSWNSTREYVMYDYVKRNEIPYAALKPSQGVDPATDNGSYWTPIVNPEAGYNKIGDMYYAIIKYIVSLG